MFRKVDISTYQARPGRYAPSPHRGLLLEMQPGDCWDIPPGANLRSIRATCVHCRTRAGVNVVVRPNGLNYVVVCLERIAPTAPPFIY